MVSVASAQNLSTMIPEAALWFWSQDGKIFEISQTELSEHNNAFVSQFVPKSGATFSSLNSSLEAMKDKTVIISLHGTEGEDGTLQELFEEAKIKFTGSNSKSSKLAFDKRATKKLAASNELPVVTDLALNNFDNGEIEKLNVFFS